MSPHSRRDFLGTAATTMAALSLPRLVLSAADPGDAIQAAIEKQRGEGVQRLQEWVRQPSIAAENRGMTEGCELMMKRGREPEGSGVGLPGRAARDPRGGQEGAREPRPRRRRRGGDRLPALPPGRA